MPVIFSHWDITTKHTPPVWWFLPYFQVLVFTTRKMLPSLPESNFRDDRRTFLEFFRCRVKPKPLAVRWLDAACPLILPQLSLPCFKTHLFFSVPFMSCQWLSLSWVSSSPYMSFVVPKPTRLSWADTYELMCLFGVAAVFADAHQPVTYVVCWGPPNQTHVWASKESNRLRETFWRINGFLHIYNRKNNQ